MNPPAARGGLPILWTNALVNAPRGLGLSREKGWLLVWDDQHWLYVLNQSGEVQSQRRFAGKLVSACCDDDGTSFAAVGSRGQVLWLAPDLMPRWERTMPSKAVAATLDSFGQYLAVSDTKGNLHVFDRLGRLVCQVNSPRPLHHLSFIPAAPFLVGTADFGLVACFDLGGRWVWRDGLVAHVGALAVCGAGDFIQLACYSEEIHGYSLTGQKLACPPVGRPCRQVSVSFDGRRMLIAGLPSHLLVLDAAGNCLHSSPLDRQIVAMALAALGDRAYLALDDGALLGLDLRNLS